jgi:L-ascorbate metabolism protein UlaG (beta-lactamase superfamily)
MVELEGHTRSKGGHAVRAVYLAHSGFFVDTGGPVLIFDYYKDTPRGGALADGVVNASALEGRDVYVFVSHIHHDHFNPVVFQWETWAGRIHYILSHDVPMRAGALRIRPGETRMVGDARIRALCSNDEGVAFLVKCGGTCVFHAGDLNWWHWNGEGKAYNDDMGRRYREQIDLLQGEQIDMAFIPVDPRLEDKYILGIDYFMRRVGARHVIPMHLWDDYALCRNLVNDPAAASYRDRIVPYTHRGQTLEL